MMFDWTEILKDGRQHQITVRSADGRITQYVDGWRLDDTTGTSVAATEENGE